MSFPTTICLTKQESGRDIPDLTFCGQLTESVSGEHEYGESSTGHNIWFVPDRTTQSSVHVDMVSACIPGLHPDSLSGSSNPIRVSRGVHELARVTESHSESDLVTVIVSAESHHTRGNFASAICEYEKALSFPSFHDTLEAKTLYNLSTCYKALGEHDMSERMIESLSSIPNQGLDPLPSPARPLAVCSAPLDLVRLAKECERSGDYKTAIRYLEIVSVSRAFRSDPSLLVWLSRLDESRSQSLRTAATSILPSI